MKTHYINQEASLLKACGKNTIIAIGFASLLLASAVSAHATGNQKIVKDIDKCQSITVNYLENGVYNGGDSEQLFMNLTIKSQQAKAKQFVQASTQADMTLINGNCNINIHYKRNI